MGRERLAGVATDEIVALREARSAYDQHDWTRARAALGSLDESLEARDLERLAWACRWSDDIEGFVDALERAEARFLTEGDRCGAARMALEHARHDAVMMRGDMAFSWYFRAVSPNQRLHAPSRSSKR